MQHLGIMGRVLCRSTGYEVKWEMSDYTNDSRCRWLMDAKAVREMVL